MPWFPALGLDGWPNTRSPPRRSAGWVRPALDDPGVRRDARKLLHGISRRQTVQAAERLPGFERPTPLAWAPADRFFRFSFAERLLERFPNGRLERVEDAATGSRADDPDDLGGRVLQSVLTALRLLVDAPHLVETV